MNKLVRATLALVSLALSSALYAGSADVNVDSGQSINISIGGTTDGNITIVNLDTNQTVATVSALTTYGGSYGTSYYYTGDTYVSGATITSNGYTSATVSGLPAGNYRVIATAWQMSDFSSYSWGNYAEISLYNPYYGSEWMDFYFSIN